jgi:hypothetical protein
MGIGRIGQPFLTSTIDVGELPVSRHCPLIPRDKGSAMVKALIYKPEGRGFETRWGECIFSMYLVLPAALGPGIYSTTNRNDYQKQQMNVSRE